MKPTITGDRFSIGEDVLTLGVVDVISIATDHVSLNVKSLSDGILVYRVCIINK